MHTRVDSPRYPLITMFEQKTAIFLLQVTKAKSREVSLQTDALNKRPISPPYVRSKSGVDASTQIEPLDLFNFDVEVGSILEVLTGKTMEQALVEVEHEEEIRAIQIRRSQLKDETKMESGRIKWLENYEKNIWKAKQQKLKEENERLDRESLLFRKAQAVTTSKMVVKNVLESTFDRWLDQYLNANVTRRVESNFMPWLSKQVDSCVSSARTTKDLTDQLVRESVALAHKRFANHKCWIRVVVKRAGSDDESLLGPVPVMRAETVAQVISKLEAWIRSEESESGVASSSSSRDLSLWYNGRCLGNTEPLLSTARDLQLLEVRES